MYVEQPRYIPIYANPRANKYYNFFCFIFVFATHIGLLNNKV